METKHNSSMFTMDYDLGICFSGVLTNYIIISSTSASLGVVMQTTVAILCLLDKRYNLTENALILVTSLLNIVFVIFYTLTFLLQEASHCGWIQLNNASCKALWWLRHFAFISINFMLALSIHETNPKMTRGSEKGRTKRFLLLIFLTILQIGIFTSHYLVLVTYASGNVGYKEDFIMSGYCTADRRHSLVLETIEFIVGTAMPLFLVLVNMVYCLLKKLEKFLSKEKMAIPQQVSKRSQMEKKISSRAVLTKHTKKHAQNVFFWTCMLSLTIFMLVPQRLMEFVLFIQSDQISWLSIGLNNKSELGESAWRNLIVVVVLAPIVSSLFVLPLYCFFTDQGRSLFKRLYTSRKTERNNSHPLQRQRPIRMHISDDASMRRCYSISDESNSNE